MDIKIGIVDEDEKKSPPQRLPTTKMFLNWVDHLSCIDAVKDKFRALVYKIPSTSYLSVINKVHSYMKRFEEELSKEKKNSDYVKKDLSLVCEIMEKNDSQKDSCTQESCSNQIEQENITNKLENTGESGSRNDLGE